MTSEIRDIPIQKTIFSGSELIEMQEAAGGNNSSKYLALHDLANYAHRTKVGFIDYNDAATATTPLLHIGGIDTKLTNDGLGPFTNRLYLPEGITDVWDPINNQFDWTELSLGDMVDLRVDIDVTTTSINQEVDIEINLAVGSGGQYALALDAISRKSVDTYKMVSFTGGYAGDLNTLNFPAEIILKSTDNCLIRVNGWYVKIIRR